MCGPSTPDRGDETNDALLGAHDVIARSVARHRR